MSQPTGQPQGGPPPSWQQPPQQPVSPTPPPPSQMPSWTSNLTNTAPVAGPAGYYYADVPNRIIAYIIDIIVLFIIGLVVSAILLGILGGKDSTFLIITIVNLII